MFKSTLLAGSLLFAGLCFGQQSSFREHKTPATLLENQTLKNDLTQIQQLEQLAGQAVSSSRSRGTEINNQLQAAYKKYQSDLRALAKDNVSASEKNIIETEEQFVTTFIH